MGNAGYEKWQKEDRGSFCWSRGFLAINFGHSEFAQPWHLRHRLFRLPANVGKMVSQPPATGTNPGVNYGAWVTLSSTLIGNLQSAAQSCHVSQHYTSDQGRGPLIVNALNVVCDSERYEIF